MKREFIDGHWWIIKRDADGNIVSKAGDDPQPVFQESPERISVKQLMGKDLKEWTDLDSKRALQFLLRKALR